MGDDELSLLGQIIFSVKKHKDLLVFKRISPNCEERISSDFEGLFSDVAKAEIESKCTLALSGEDSSGSFSADINGSPYIITLLTQMQHAFIFLAAEERAGKANSISENAVFYKLCNTAESGIFFWRVKNNEFYLYYANASYFVQTELPGKSLRKRPEDIFSPKKASTIRSQLDKCVGLMKPVSFHCSFNKKTFAVTLYPEVSDGKVTRVMGVSTDITEQVINLTKLYQNSMQVSQNEAMLREHIRFEEVLSQSAREFLASDLSGFNGCLERMIQSLGSLFDADWAFAYKNNTDLCGSSCQWLAHDEPGRNRLRNTAENASLSPWISSLRAGRIFVVNDIDKELPSLHAALKCAGSPEVRSFIAVPVLRSDEVWGALCISTFHQKRIWTTRDIGVLKTAADIIMSAYIRTKMEKQLNESNRVLVEYDECLQDMLSVEESLSAATRQFLNADTQEFGHCVTDMLRMLSELTDADQAFICAFQSTTPKCYSWHKKGFSSPAYEPEKYNQIFSGWNEFLKDTDHVVIEDVSKQIGLLPASVQDYTLSMGLKSQLIVPIRNGKSLVAILFIAKILGSCRWDNPAIHTAKQFSLVFHDAYLKMCRQQQLLLEASNGSNAVQNMLCQAQLIKTTAECAQQLIDATADTLPSIYSLFCKSIAQHLPVDSMNLTQYSQDYTKTMIVFNWHATGPLPKNSDSQPDGRDSLVLSIPVFYREIVWGCLLVNLVSQPSADGFMRALEMVAECFVRAYMRIHGDGKGCMEGKKHAAIVLAPRPFAI